MNHKRMLPLHWKLLIRVEYAIKDDEEKRNGCSADRSCDGSPGRMGHGGGWSPSPYRRERTGLDYGRGLSPSLNRGERASHKERIKGLHGGSRSRSSPRERPSPDDDSELIPREGDSESLCHTPSPQRERISPDDYCRSPSLDSKPEMRASPNYEAENPKGDREIGTVVRHLGTPDLNHDKIGLTSSL